MHLKREQMRYRCCSHRQPSDGTHPKVSEQDSVFLPVINCHHAFRETTAEAEP